MRARSLFLNPLLFQLEYYENNTCKTRALLQAIVEAGVRHVIFSSTAAVYGSQGQAPIAEDASTNPESPYGRSKLMTEWMLSDASVAHGFTFTALRYFNVAGADPRGRTGQSTPGATHLIKVACETAIGKRPAMDVFGTDYPTPTVPVSATIFTSATLLLHTALR